MFVKGQATDSVFSFLHPDYNIDKFLGTIKEKNSLEFQTAFQLLGVGFSVGENLYLTLDINDRIEGNAVIPGDFFRLVFKGNAVYRGSSIDLSALRGDLKYYREYGLGFSKNFTEKLRIGFKGKLLFGIVAGSIENQSLGLTVNNDLTHTLNADLKLNISGPVKFSRDVNGKIDSIWIDKTRFDSGQGRRGFLMNSKNPGFSIDLGATYDLSDKISVSAAITDFGFINWRKDIITLQASGGIKLNGSTMQDVYNGTKTFDELTSVMIDSLKKSIIVSDSDDPFTTFLPFGVTLGGKYNLTERFSAGLISYTRFIGKQVRESLTLSGNLNLGNIFSASLAYTAENHRYDNLGAGVAVRAGVCQFYLIADRIPLVWDKIRSVDKDNHERKVILPANWNTINLRVGMNLVFGNSVKKKIDKPMVPVE
jgi:hypothetical protein